MNLPKIPPTYLKLQILFNHGAEQTITLRSAKGIRYLALPIVMAGAFLYASLASPVFASGGQQASAKEAPAIDPGAIEALNKMGIYLRTLKSFQVYATATTDNVLDDGQTIQFSRKADIIAALPNRLRGEITDDDGHRFFFFDGKNFTIFGEVVKYYATVPAPPTIRELNNALMEKYDIELPLVDLFRWGTEDSGINKIKAAVDIGPSAVDDVTCEQYAFRQDGVDWQIWIQLGEFPLPRKLVIRTLTDDAKPQHSETLTWNLAPSFSENAFTFDPPAGVQRIPLEEMKATSTEKKK